MSIHKTIRDNRDKLEIETMYNRKTKNRCPICHRYSLFIKEDKSIKCIRCNNFIKINGKEIIS